MADGGTRLPWQVIRQDEGGHRYRVGRYATRAEAERVIGGLGGGDDQQLYVVEKMDVTTG
ncbi:SPOR domain-containing protein [Streptomyces sp. NPDC014733]|uniref:SPOR domain-containing protein n=1 Tax=Streptomyces sp. NPDC014733 TaxID=3364885 RepID=UPI0036F7E521